MARNQVLALNQVVNSNPYPRAKEQQPLNTHCVVCDRIIQTKDWSSHKNSKKHRQLEEGHSTKENQPTGFAVNGASAFTNHTDGFNDDVPWGTSDSTTAFGSAEPSTAWGTDSFGNNDNFDTNMNHRGGNGGGGGACYGCGEVGHSKRDCPKSIGGRGCFNCGEVGHNKADCPNRPQDRGGRSGGSGGGRPCFICNEVGHMKADCPQRGSGGGGGSNQECHNCYQIGHRKADCPNERVMKCRNCDGIGHMGKDCPQPKDWSRVKCNNCQLMGHTVKRCNNPPAEPVGGGWGDNGTGGGATGGWDKTESEAVVPGGAWDETSGGADNTQYADAPPDW